jgi:major type 1 subunit fimbrin (pilin)
MKKVAMAALVAATTGLIAGTAHADSTAVNFAGQVTGGTCTIIGNGQSNNFTVTLPKVSASELSAAGSTAGSTGFTIALTNCTPATGNVRVYWQGTNTLSDGNLANSGGTAGKVEVQLVDYNSGMHTIDVSKADGSQNSYPVALGTGGNAILKYAAQYASPAGGTTAGTVATNVTYSVIYP